jgi:hypothetical protein
MPAADDPVGVEPSGGVEPFTSAEPSGGAEPSRQLSDRPVGQRRQSDLVRRATALLSPLPADAPSRYARPPVGCTSASGSYGACFDEAVGVSPRHFRADRPGTRRTRPARPGRGGAGRLAELADGAGYYDQSHLTAEFRRLMGVPPGAFLAG